MDDLQDGLELNRWGPDIDVEVEVEDRLEVERSESCERDEETFRVKPVTKVLFQPKKRLCPG